MKLSNLVAIVTNIRNNCKNGCNIFSESSAHSKQFPFVFSWRLIHQSTGWRKISRISLSLRAETRRHRWRVCSVKNCSKLATQRCGSSINAALATIAITCLKIPTSHCLSFFCSILKGLSVEITVYLRTLHQHFRNSHRQLLFD